MATLIRDRYLEQRLIARRRRLGHDKFDEVWNGVYIMVPAPKIGHQDVSGDLYALLREVVQDSRLGRVTFGVNISDRREDWTKNFRIPHVAVFLNGTSAVNCETHWFGGPDFAGEVVSPKDRTKKKIPFYAQVGTRELLIIDRDPWELSLYRLTRRELVLAGTSTVESGEWFDSPVVPLSFRLIEGVNRPRIEVRHSNQQKNWIV